MKYRWVVLLLAVPLGALVPAVGFSQRDVTGSDVKRDRTSGSELRQNSPNPFVRETRITFTVGDYPKCEDPGKTYRISLQIYNILSQVVGVPVLQGGSGSVADGAALQNVTLTCGEYTAYWDAKHVKTKQEVAAGVYIYRMEVDKRPLTMKMIKGK